MTVLQETRAALTDGVLVVVDAGRLLVRHFPALLTVFLLGLAGRNAAMWVAVVVGRDHVVLASLLVPLAPLSMVIAFVVMLRIAGGALTGDDGSLSASRRLALLTSALVPFLTVYALTGELTNDRNQFLNESYADEQQNTVFDPSTGIADRSIATVDHLQLIMVVVFLAIRFAIDRLDLEERHTAWGLVQALVEVTWLTWLATYITRQWGSVKDWFGDLVAVGWAKDAWTAFSDWLGPVADPLRALGHLFSETFHGVGTILATPLAWLAVGAVVIVGGLPQARPEMPVSARRFRDRLTPGLTRLRSGRAGAKITELLGRRFADLADAVRVVVHAGLLPVLTFCLVLPLARLAEWGAATALRALIGPRDPDTMIYFSTYLDIVTRAAYTLAVVFIVVAAVSRLLLRPPQVPGAPTAVTWISVGGPGAAASRAAPRRATVARAVARAAPRAGAPDRRPATGRR